MNMYVHSQTHTHAHTYTHTHHRHHSAVEHAQILLPIAEEVPLSVAIRWVDRELMDPALITEEEEELGVEEEEEEGTAWTGIAAMRKKNQDMSLKCRMQPGPVRINQKSNWDLIFPAGACVCGMTHLDVA